MNEQSVLRALTGLPVSAVRTFDTLDSTNDEALRWLGQGAPDSSLVVARTQTAGRGRAERIWFSRPEASLTFSWILRPEPGELRLGGLFSLYAGVALSLALEESYGLRPLIKWPNDVLLSGRKVAGILTESTSTGSMLEGVVIGVGINLTPAGVPGDPSFPATCLQSFVRDPIEPEACLTGVLRALMDLRPALQAGDIPHMLNERLAFRREPVLVIDPVRGSVAEGMISRVDEQGRLELKTRDAEQVAFEEGELHLRPAEEERSANDR